MDNVMEKIRTATDPCSNGIREVAGFDLPTSTKEKFKNLAISMHESRSQHILKRLTIEGGSRHDWLNSFLNGRTYVEEGLAASYYHLNNVEIFEQKVVSLALKELPNIQTPHGFLVKVNRANKLNFEYQAFVFALRRTMEYLAVSVAAFFKRNTHSIRDLSDSIRMAEPCDISDKISTKLETLLSGLSDILSGTDGWSLRDKIAHLKTANAWLEIRYTPDGKNKINFVVDGLGTDIVSLIPVLKDN
jgi:hypothetical protein